MRKILFINLILIFAVSLARADALIINQTQLNNEVELVEMSYKQKGYLLAFIPITFTVTAVARADGTVGVMYPWYSMITIDNKKEVETELKIAVDTALSAYKVGSVQAEGKPAHPRFTATQSAQVSSVMHSVFKSRFENQEFVDNSLE